MVVAFCPPTAFASSSTPTPLRSAQPASPCAARSSASVLRASKTHVHDAAHCNYVRRKYQPSLPTSPCSSLAVWTTHGRRTLRRHPFTAAQTTPLLPPPNMGRGGRGKRESGQRRMWHELERCGKPSSFRELPSLSRGVLCLDVLFGPSTTTTTPPPLKCVLRPT